MRGHHQADEDGGNDPERAQGEPQDGQTTKTVALVLTAGLLRVAYSSSAIAPVR
jgi:hypothetical protein